MRTPTCRKLHSVTEIATAAVEANRFINISGAHALPWEAILGVSEGATAIGGAFSVVTGYSALVLAAAAIAAGDSVGPAADGTGRAVQGGSFAALGDAAAGELVEVRVATMGAVAGGRAAAVLAAIGNASNSIYVAGDSLCANGFGASGNNYIATNTEGVFTWLDAFLGGAFNLLGSTAVGGKTCRQMIDEQFPTIIAAGSRYCMFTAGTNDLYLGLANAATTYDRIIEAVEKLLVAGITPIWSTIWGRVYSASYTALALQINERLRRYAYTQKAGLFVDGYVPTHNPAGTTGAGRTPLASYFYDSVIHPNNLLAMRLGQYYAQAIGSRIYQPNRFVIGNEDVTTGYNGSNLLVNPNFTGSVAVASANCAGVMPTGWILDWATRGGGSTAIATSAIVSLTDATTGLAVGQAIQITISGTGANGDIVRVTQTHTQNPAFLTNLSAGNVFNCEGQLGVATGATVRELRIRGQVNGNESSWWGVNDKTAVDYPASVPLVSCQSRNLAVLGAGAATAARYDMRVTFSGNSNGTVLTFARPRFRKVS